jgi:hypothetical protein
MYLPVEHLRLLDDKNLFSHFLDQEKEFGKLFKAVCQRENALQIMREALKPTSEEPPPTPEEVHLANDAHKMLVNLGKIYSFCKVTKRKANQL